jgi:hypothetical protein
VAWIGIRVARSLYSRWRVLAPADRARLEPLAEEAKRSALDVRGAEDRAAAERDLEHASQNLAAAIVETAEADPELDEVEVKRLRGELTRELERLAGADIRASRGPGAAAPPPTPEQ